MITNFFSLRAVLTSMVMFLCLIVDSAIAQADKQADNTAIAQEARSFVVALADRTIESLTEKEIDKTERRNRFRALMLEYFAFKSIAKWVLGRYWRRANETQRKEFMVLFEDLLVVVYADRFAKYSGLRLDVGKSEIRGANDILVHSILKRSQGVKSVGVIWRVRRNRDKFKIVDLMVEGLSMGLTQQKEFSSVIRKNGGKVQGLIEELRKRVAANS